MSTLNAKVLQAYRIAVRLDPLYAAAWHDIAVGSLRAGDKEGAIAAISKGAILRIRMRWSNIWKIASG